MEKELVGVCAMRGRCDAKILHPVRTDYGKAIRKDYERGVISEKRKNIQRLEPKRERISNTITTVQKDNLYIGKVKDMETVEDYLYHAKDGECYGIFKLSPRECLRLMDVSDKDIDKMAAVNSNTQLYKTAGNSIVVNVLVAIFGQLFEGKENVYKEV